ncbi:MAG: hypothetical protein CMO20_01295 [Thermoplasmata archaeon]|nr:hypothetical protein [Thermoplasmata archaeon]|tara:strand:- start:2166 stop:2582 length:417 start_codon:yes stop_codon:yes gene_type:complete
MQPDKDQWGQPIKPVYGQPPQQQVVGQPTVLVGQPIVGVGPQLGMGYPATQATAALVLSILSLVGCGVCTAVPGLILANGALNVTNQHPNHPDAGSARAAMIIAWISIGLFLLGIIIWGFIIVLGLGLGGAAVASEGY